MTVLLLTSPSNMIDDLYDSKNKRVKVADVATGVTVLMKQKSKVQEKIENSC